MQQQGRTVEQVLGRIARVQHGVVTREQLLRAEITAEEIRRRLAKKALLREYRASIASGTKKLRKVLHGDVHVTLERRFLDRLPPSELRRLLHSPG
jgi:hypothetical protein